MSDFGSELISSLKEVVEREGLDAGKLSAALPTTDDNKMRITDRTEILVTDGEKVGRWKVSTLRELFRGNRQPPPDMDRYPEDYCTHFFFIEMAVLLVCDATIERTDQELESAYSALRRRPDGKSAGEVHDFLWQVSALLLGMNALSEAEFVALLQALEGSTRKWAIGPLSRNYVVYLRDALSDLEES